MRLVGVEFIVFASDWAHAHPEGGTPMVDGHLTNYVGEPNRYGSAGVLRIARVGVGAQPARQLRRLEHARVVR
ncbi:MAG TPA: hypothetical protein VMV45_02190 [Casimicrobiaceae bacterium]|nr:hypothetical protein [Casimicrobiaceae bacterium]